MEQLPQDQQIAQAIRQELNSLAAYLRQPNDTFDINFTLSNINVLVKQHPQQMKFFAPEDIGLMARGLRQRYGTAIVKAEKKGKSRKKKTAKAQAVGLTLEELNSLAF